MPRDREVTARFEKRGWTVVRIWECELEHFSEIAIKRTKW